jgi:hypothetical protein
MAKKTQAAQGLNAAEPWVMSIEDAGRKYFGVGKTASYRLADRGTLATMQVGERRRALPRVIEKQLSGEK